MAKRPRAETTAATAVETAAEPLRPDAIPLPVTPSQLAACIENQRRALVHIIADKNSPPIDGGLVRIVGALDALTRIVPTLEEEPTK